MKLKYNVTGGDRKRMVAIISREARCQAVYTRMPECAYIIGNIKVTRDGELIWDERTDSDFMDMIVEALTDEGFHPASQEEAEQENEAAAHEEPETADGSEAGVETEAETEGESPAEEATYGVSDEQLPETNGEACMDEEMESAETGETEEETSTLEEEAGSGAAEEAGTAASEDIVEASTEEAGASGTEETDAHAEEETSGRMEISVPKDSFTEAAFSNLEKIIGSKRNLLMKALEADSLPVRVTDDKITFPWFRNPEGDPVTTAAYAHLVEGICRMAKEAKRVVATERETESEKYTFRCFLLRLGFVGPEYKHERAVLMKNLSGHTAFKTQEEADVFYAKLKAKKEAQKRQNEETAATVETDPAAPEETNGVES